MTSQPKRESYYFPDGSEIELTVRTDDLSVYRIFRTDIVKRMRHIRAASAETDTTLAAFRSSVPRDRMDDCRSTTTHALPAGEVIVSIDASGKGMHGYLYYLVRAAVAYTHSVNLEPAKAGLLATPLLATGIALGALGQWYLSIPLFGVGGTILLHLLVYGLSASGVPVSLSRTPKPADPDSVTERA